MKPGKRHREKGATMFESVFNGLPLLGRASLLLAIAFCVGLGLLNGTRCRSWMLHRATWAAVIVVGVLALLPVGRTWELAVLTPPEEIAAEIQDPEIDDTEIAFIPSASAAETPAMPSPHALETPAPVDTPPVALISFQEMFSMPVEPAPAANLEPVAVSEPILTETPSEEAEASIDWTAWIFPALFAVWLSGVLFFSLRFFYRMRKFQCFLHENIIPEDADAAWSGEWRRIQELEGVKRPVPMLVAEDFGPALTRRPEGYALIVPLEGWDRLSAEERESIMRHELAHYRRGDIWKSCLARFLTLPHWFNPLAWAAVRRYEDAAEWACDEAALGERGEAVSTFARALVSLHETSLQRPGIVVPESALQHNIFGRNISRRVARLLTFNPLKNKDSIMKKLFLLGACALLVCTAFVQIRLVAQNPASEESPSIHEPGTAINEPGTVSPESETIAAPENPETPSPAREESPARGDGAEHMKLVAPDSYKNRRTNYEIIKQRGNPLEKSEIFLSLLEYAKEEYDRALKRYEMKLIGKQDFLIEKLNLLEIENKYWSMDIPRIQAPDRLDPEGLELLRTRVECLEIHVENLRKLRENNVVPQKELDEAEAALRDVRQDWNEAKERSFKVTDRETLKKRLAVPYFIGIDNTVTWKQWFGGLEETTGITFRFDHERMKGSDITEDFLITNDKIDLNAVPLRDALHAVLWPHRLTFHLVDDGDVVVYLYESNVAPLAYDNTSGNKKFEVLSPGLVKRLARVLQARLDYSVRDEHERLAAETPMSPEELKVARARDRFYTSRYFFDVYEAAGDFASLKLVLEGQLFDLPIIVQNASPNEKAWFETAESDAKILLANLPGRPVPAPTMDGLENFQAEMKDDPETLRKKMIAARVKYLDVVALYLAGAKGGRAIDEARAKRDWLDAYIKWAMVSCDTWRLRYGLLERMRNADNLFRATEASRLAGIADVSANDLEDARQDVETSKTDLFGRKADIRLLARNLLTLKNDQGVIRLAVRRDGEVVPVFPVPVAVNPDYVALLQKRAETAKARLDGVEAAYKMGAPGGSAVSYADARIAHADAEAALYRAMDDGDKTIAAVKRKVEAAKEKLASGKSAYNSGTTTHDKLLDAELALTEAEYELKQAEKKPAETETPEAPLSPWISMFQNETPGDAADPDRLKLLEKRVEVAKQRAMMVKAQYLYGAPGGRAQFYHEAEMQYAGALAELYLASGDREKAVQELLRKAVHAQERYKAAEAGYKVATVSLDDVLQAEADVDETLLLVKAYDATALENLETQRKIEYEALNAAQEEMRQQFEKPREPAPAAPTPPVPAPERLTPTVKFQGRTFESWVQDLETELDPKMRAEAFRALATFGANGRGREAAETIIAAVKPYNFDRLPYNNDDPVDVMKVAAVRAFTSVDIAIPTGDSFPLLMRLVKEGNKNELSFAAKTLLSLVNPDGINELAYEALSTGDLDALGEDRVKLLFDLLRGWQDTQWSLKFLREAVQNGDEKRFGLMFAHFKSDEEGTMVPYGGGEVGCYKGIFPPIADYENQKVWNRETWTKTEEGWRISPFGENLLKLLQEDGVKSENETIRETSKKVVEVLSGLESPRENR